MDEVGYLAAKQEITRLNADLLSYVKKIELKFKYDDLLSRETLTLVNNMHSCAYKLRQELNTIQTKADISSITKTTTWISAICKGAVDHYRSGNKTKYYFVLMEELEPYLKIYKRQSKKLKRL